MTARRIPQKVAEVMWLGGDKKGGYTALDRMPREVLRLVESAEHEPEEDPSFSPQGTPDFHFDFIEICGGSARVSRGAGKDLVELWPRLLSCQIQDILTLAALNFWHGLQYMAEKRRIRAVMVEPVCTTFSPAAHPAVRSYKMPLGYDRLCPKTFRGNLIAFRCLAIAWTFARHLLPALVEQPRLSKMAWLSSWIFLKEHFGFQEAVVASCQFGSPHRKEFRLLGFGLDMKAMETKCPGGHQHLIIAGKYTKP